MNFRHLSFFFLALILFGCYKDVDNSKPVEEIVEITEVYINTKIAGAVLDTQGKKLSSYSLVMNNEEFFVDDGDFIIQATGIKKKGQTIFVKKDGKTVGLTTVLLMENDINQIFIEAFPVWKSAEGQTGQKLFDLGTMHLKADESTFLTSQDNKYTGEVHFTFGEISNSNFITAVGYSDLVDLYAVEPLGGFYLDFSDQNELMLNIDPTQPLFLTIDKIPTRATAIFHFDEIHERWIKMADIDPLDGALVQIQSAGLYIFANIATGIFASGEVVFDDNPVSYQSLSWKALGLSTPYLSTMLGQWITVLPENTDVLIELKNTCGQTIQSDNIETSKSNITGSQLIVSNNTDKFGFLDLKVVDCDGNTVENPSLIINQNTAFHFLGNRIKTWINTDCGEFSIAAKASLDQEVGLSIPWNSSTFSLSTISTCGDLADGYSYFEIDGEKKLYHSFQLTKENGRSVFSSKDHKVKIIVDGQSVGMYKEEQVNIYMNDDSFGDSGYFVNCGESAIGCGITECIISQYETNGLTTVKISGKVWILNLPSNEANTLSLEAVLIINT